MCLHEKLTLYSLVLLVLFGRRNSSVTIFDIKNVEQQIVSIFLIWFFEADTFNPLRTLLLTLGGNFSRVHFNWSL